MAELDRLKQRLCDEFKDYPHTKRELLGNAACRRKIRDLIIEYILESITQSICFEEIKTLMVECGVSNENFEKEILPYIDSYYKAKELIENGYCNKLLK